ncbi:MAG TPA: hypothetical protein P5102_15240 [Candidatus Competibacteraceae bacterium]|nr:hypothetical protein [Candidatus Competibacteraceae bacterium]HRZ07468.1 hypothetical protein [Candidatus Competibacteraceae bacterium]HSA47839.1 hypothetical protein [Candidatus Competibacteraceae bacterium]
MADGIPVRLRVDGIGIQHPLHGVPQRPVNDRQMRGHHNPILRRNAAAFAVHAHHPPEHQLPGQSGIAQQRQHAGFVPRMTAIRQSLAVQRHRQTFSADALGAQREHPAHNHRFLRDDLQPAAFGVVQCRDGAIAERRMTATPVAALSGFNHGAAGIGGNLLTGELIEQFENPLGEPAAV